MPFTLLPNQARWGYIPFDNGGPVLMPTNLTFEISRECFVERAEIINSSGGAITINLQDGNGVPLIPIDYSLADKAIMYYSAEEGRRCPGGIQWKASSGSAVYGYIRGRIS